MRTSKLLSKKKIKLFLIITTNLQFQHHIVLLLFLYCRLFVNLCSFRYLLLAFAVGVTDIAVDFRLFSSFVAHTYCNKRNFNPKLMMTTCDVFLYGDVM